MRIRCSRFLIENKKIAIEYLLFPHGEFLNGPLEKDLPDKEQEVPLLADLWQPIFGCGL